MTFLSELNNKLKNFVDYQYHLAKKQLIFINWDAYNFVNLIFQSLNLNNFMTISDLENAIALIEKLPIDSQNYPYIDQFIIANNHKILSQIKNDIPNYPHLQLPKANLSLSGKCIEILIEIHQTLLNYYIEGLSHTTGQQAVKETHYEPNMIDESEAFYGLAITTREHRAADNSTIIPDVRRKGVSFCGKFIDHEGQDNPHDSKIIEAIENFAGDSINNPNSKASKILYFGGQFLEAVILNEFTNTMEFTNGLPGRMERGAVKGHIDWSKDIEKNEIYANVNIKIYTFNFAYDDADKLPELYVISSDGKTLLPLPSTDSNFERVYKNYDDERLGHTTNNALHVCEYEVKIKLVFDSLTQQYYFKVDQCQLKINTPQLTSTREESLVCSAQIIKSNNVNKSENTNTNLDAEDDSSNSDQKLFTFNH
ncbi:hypothetical protein ACNVED_06935 [Legionella sp. D16C41]|uniref:hypothetical protein n=1 Tax=Legionella sp. D16C41 TaxID=3402688 RepID=UPI003AF7B806